MPKHGLQAKNLSKPVDVGTVKIGQYIVIDGEPCRIVEYEKSKPGKHGAAKARIVAISVTTGSKKNVISPVDARIDVPMIEKKTGASAGVCWNECSNYGYGELRDVRNTYARGGGNQDQVGSWR